MTSPLLQLYEARINSTYYILAKEDLPILYYPAGISIYSQIHLRLAIIRPLYARPYLPELFKFNLN